MDAKTFTSVEIPANVVASLNVLSPDRRQQVFDFVEFLSQKQKVPLRTEDVQMGNSKTERVLGLHTGKGWVSDDFELPLPDEFWSTQTSSGTAQ
jgi:hypothetical protein